MTDSKIGTVPLATLRWYFYAIDSLFKLAWVLWVPTFFIYLTFLFHGNQSDATSIILVTYLFMFIFEVTTGAVADATSGISSFMLACGITAMSYLIYSLAAFHRDLGYALAVLAELVGGIGMSLFSGAFERWFQSTLELNGETRSPSELFSGLRGVRHTISTIGGTIGIFLFYRFQSHYNTTGDLRGTDFLLIPHTWAALFVLAAAVLAYFLRASLVRADMMVAGGRLAKEMPHAASLRDPRAVRRRISDILLRRTLPTIAQGWKLLLTMPQLRGAVYLTSAHQLGLTITSFLFPILLWVGTDARDPWFLAAYWSATQILRLVGARHAQGRLKRRSAWTPGEIAVVGTVLNGIVFVGAGVLAIQGYPSRGVALTGLGIMFLLGLTEPYVDGIAQSYAPPDLRSVVASFKSMLSVGFCVVAIVPISLIATWHTYENQISFGHMFAITGSMIASLGFLAVRSFLPAPVVHPITRGPQ